MRDLHTGSVPMQLMGGERTKGLEQADQQLEATYLSQGCRQSFGSYSGWVPSI